MTKASFTLKTGECGTEVKVIPPGDMKPAEQDPSPEFTADEGTELDVCPPDYGRTALWLTTPEIDLEDFALGVDKWFSGTMKPGDKLYAGLMPVAKLGHFIDPDHLPTVTVNGEKAELKNLAENEYGYFVVVAEVTITHDWTDWKQTKAPTYDAEGEEERECRKCGAKETRPVKKLDPEPAPTPAPQPKVSGMLIARMTAKGRTGMNISWSKISGAAGYDIYLSECNHGDKTFACRKAKTVKGNGTLSWTKTGLKKKTAYKGYVKAYTMKNGKKSYIRKSLMVHAFTGGHTKNYTNAKSVTVNKTRVTLGEGKAFKIKVKVRKLNPNKRLLSRMHTPALRYMTSDKKVATVNSKGRNTARGKGSCVICVLAHNGASKRIKVTVK